MRVTSVRILRAGWFIVTFLTGLLECRVAHADDCHPHDSGNIASLSCFQSHACTNPTDACYVPNPNGCAGTVNANTNCNPTPSDYQVTFWQDANYQGGCITFEVPANSGALSVPYLGTWGFNDCISSLKVGAKVRLHAYKDANQGSGGSFYSSSANAGIVYWKATYEPGPQSNIGTYGADEDSFSSLVIENRALLPNKERIPFTYRGDYPSNKPTIWSEEAQGLCHNNGNWFITKEAYLPDSIAYAPLIGQSCRDGFVLMDGYCTNPNYIDAFSSCLLNDDGHRYTGRIYRWPLETDLSQEQEPLGVKHRDQSEFDFLIGGTLTHSTKLGYRHFGDPDCMTIQGKDYVFIPVESCGSQVPGVVLVLDSDLKYIATWAVPAGPGAGTLGWVALRPGTEAAPELWVAGDITAGKGLHKLQGQLCAGVPCDNLTLVPAGDVLLRSFQGTPEYFPNVSGGVFSPSGKTLYLTRGKTSEYGGVHVIDPDSGQTLADSGSVDDGHCYGPFCYGANVSGLWGDEPEGMDFLDTRCTDKIIPGITGGLESQLHVFLLNNNITDIDNIRMKHYSINGGSTQSGEWGETGLPLICDRGTSGPGPGSAAAWKAGTIGTTMQPYPAAFNLFVFGNVSGLQDTQGPIAAGGTVNLSNFNLNWSQTQPVGLVSAGALTLTNGRVSGLGYYGTTETIGNGVTCDASCSSSIAHASPIDFGAARSKLQGMARYLRSYQTNGTVNLTYSTLTLTGSNPTLNTFMVSAFDLAHTYSVTINAPNTSTVIINVSGNDVAMVYMGFNINGLDQHKMLWNFYEAGRIATYSVGFPGSILAPDADVFLNNGNINGTLVANSFSGLNEFHYVPFRYDLLL